MKQLLIIFLLSASILFAQQKDSVMVDDTTKINSQLAELQQQYNKAQTVIDNMLKKIDEMKALQNQILGAASVWTNQKKELLETKYKKKVK